MTAEARKAAREMAREYLRVDMLATTVPLSDVVDDIIDAYEAALAETHVIMTREAFENELFERGMDRYQEGYEAGASHNE